MSILTSPGRQRQECLAVGLAAVVLSLGAVAAIAANAPWQIRFPLVVVAGLFGPAVPVLRAISTLSFGECIVYGLGAGIALQMLLGLGLVLIHIWTPVQVFVGLLVISFAIGAKLIVEASMWGNHG